MNRTAFSIISVTVFLMLAHIALADTYPVIVQGKVTMEDGAAPPFQVSIERVCSDGQGDVPGPLTNKKGEFLWRIEIDPFATRSCVFRASHPGYVSSVDDASNLNLTSRATQITIPPLMLAAASADPYSIRITDSNVPGKARGSIEKAMKALDSRNAPEAAANLQAAVAAAPKFAQGWHALGVVQENLGKASEAREAYTHAIESDPKNFPSYVTLARLCIKAKDWQCADKNAESLIKVDPKKTYPEIYLHRAVAQYELKDVAGAEASVQEVLRLDKAHKKPRAEYVLGRILEAKGDANGAREHITKYIQLDPNAADMLQVKAHLENLGKPATPEADPDLEPL
jgi:Tfp pilus assembly protein PilF